MTLTTTAGNRLPAAPRLPRLLAGAPRNRPAGLTEHLALHGRPPLGGPGDRDRPNRLIDRVERSGLTGRGGAGFPTGRKLRSVLDRRGTPVVVANGSEGEPGSAKDHLLLTRVPHLVLDGISLAAYAVGADEAYLAVHRTDTAVLTVLGQALDERRQAGLAPVPIRLVGIPGRYVSSEQSAIVQYLNKGPAKPTFAPPRPHERGVHGRPTVVNNVETLGHLALIARHGDVWFRSAGTPGAPGTTLVTVSGAVGRPGVYEIEMGTPVGHTVTLAGGLVERTGAILVGGYFGTWIPADTAWFTPLTHADLRAVGGAMGAGIVIVLPESSCGLAETARVVRYLAEETAGQCGPCVRGLPELSDELVTLAYSGGRGRTLARVRQLIELVEGRGACKHPDGATHLVRSALTAFAEDAYWHDEDRPCTGLERPPLLPLPDDQARDWEFR
ncbi:NADH-ubiquinone oxidoreductase-F iron-sulfur binding region domain-containing protein [Streptomyces caeni]|uniref:NADH-ubiquinone oxidoreductase-F iron-sulfur binding region domain-containing protein n=1 Tax=Streptomyces caeni TaxID=2307231 RepID=A0ABW4IQI4_9ACTN